MALNKIQVQSRLCKNCGKSFSYALVGRGLARLHCSPTCSAQYGAALAKTKERQCCRIDGCEALATRVSMQVCEKHYYRMRRGGTFDRKPRGKRKPTSHGYMVVGIKGHPLASQNGTMYEHRLVHFDHVGPGVHNCHWCGSEVEWKAKGKRMLVVDHFDGDKLNNIPSNLVTSCHPCNGKRGLFEAWAREHRDDPFLLSLFNMQTASNPT